MANKGIFETRRKDMITTMLIKIMGFKNSGNNSMINGKEPKNKALAGVGNPLKE